MDDVPDQKTSSSDLTAEVSLVLENLRPIWLPGAEDIVIDQQAGWAYIAAQARPPGGLPAIMRLQGAVYGLDLKQDHAVPVNLTDPLFAQEFSSPPRRRRKRPAVSASRLSGRRAAFIRAGSACARVKTEAGGCSSSTIEPRRG